MPELEKRWHRIARHIGSSSRAARLSDGWLTDNIESAASLAPKIASFRAESKAAGNAGTVTINRKVGIAPQRSTLEQQWLPPILEVFKRYVRNGAPFNAALAGKLASSAHIVLTDFAPGQSVEMVAGSLEDCIRSIQACKDTTGAETGHPAALLSPVAGIKGGIDARREQKPHHAGLRRAIANREMATPAPPESTSAPLSFA